MKQISINIKENDKKKHIFVHPQFSSDNTKLHKICIMRNYHLTIISFTLSLFLCINTSAQNDTRKFIELNETENSFEVIVTDGKYIFEPYNDQIVHTTFYPKNVETKDFSHAVSMKPQDSNFEKTETEYEISLATSGISISIIKNPFDIRYNYKNKPLLAEKYGYSINDTTQAISLSLTPDEILYGGGARVLGMNRRGNKLELYNKAHYGYETHSELMNYTLPLYLSSKKYAVLFDNISKGWIDLDSKEKNTVSYETVSGTINYFVVAGDDWYNLVDQYTTLTGKQPLPPRWAFGNFSSRFGYHSQEETEQTIELFLKDSIPLDAVIIDIYWFGKNIKGEMGNLEWYKDSFPNPADMISKFKEKGIKTILVTEPFILSTSNRWDEAVSEDILCTDTTGNPYKYEFYFGNTGLIDIYKPEARDWFWNIYKELTDQGIGGWWGDLGEPEVHPTDLQHATGSADEVHNGYGHEWAKLVYEGYEKDFPNTRPFILMRAGYAGSQRYGLIPWSGDVSRSWGGLVPQPEISLQMGMQGLAYMHSDLGGFAGGEKIDKELYIRWLQYGVFQPIYRPHAQENIPAEPVFQDEIPKALAKRSIELRYKLLPYIYNMAYENHISGKPLMIPLFFNEADNKELLTYDDAYMWGDAFLVAPIKKAGIRNKIVYLPKGNEWIDFYTNEIHSGCKTISTPVKLTHIPVFVKGGSFIPMVKKTTNTEKYSLSKFEINYYHTNLTKNSEYTLYNDDGKTPTSNGNNSEIFHFKAISNSKNLEIIINKTYNIEPITFNNKIDINIIQLEKKPKSVLVNNKKIKSSEWFFNKENNKFNTKINLNNDPISIKITY